MAKIAWNDTSSYSRGERGNVAPSCWTADLGALHISIYRHIHYPKDQWLMACYEVGLDKQILAAEDAGEAQTEAVRLVKSHLGKMLKTLAALEASK